MIPYPARCSVSECLDHVRPLCISLLGKNHDLSTSLILLHTAMHLNDLVEFEVPADLNLQRPFRDLLHQVVKRQSREVFGLTSIGVKVTAVGSPPCEIVAPPLVSNDTGDTNNAILLSAAE